MSYALLKHLHISCAAASYTLFLLRGIWMLRDSAIMRQRWVKIVPHMVDTVLLGSAVALAWTIGQYPFVDSWLTAKVTALLLYIALGFVALKYGRSKTMRVSAWLAAQAIFGYIALVALRHDPLPFL
ncbi:MAG: regulator SirB [Gallionellales bacterium GWA2_60_142]|nr:MAG: regulator SirB [Gallionellales bacterium GWA2_60_142]HCI14855.1 regulator SirB [Gallionellaceae bacterium]